MTEGLRGALWQAGLFAEWRERAACLGRTSSRSRGTRGVLDVVPGVASDSAQVRAAKRVCRHCEVYDRCLAWADTLTGADDASSEVLAGMTRRERRVRRKNRNQQQQEEEGDSAG